MIDELHGFKIGETGYGFTEDGIMYSHTRNEETVCMAYLFKTRLEAIENEIKKVDMVRRELIELRDSWK